MQFTKYISWSCTPLALDWIQLKIISDGLALDWIHNKFLESQFLALNWILRNNRIKTVHFNFTVCTVSVKTTVPDGSHNQCSQHCRSIPCSLHDRLNIS